VNISERVYQFLIRAYPAQFRREYEEPMAQHFRDQLRAAPGLLQCTRLWLRTLADLIQTIPQSHLQEARGPVFMRMDQQARRSIFFAHHEAAFYSQPEITLEHLLLAVFRSDKKLQRALSSAAALELNNLRTGTPNLRPVISPNIPLSQQFRQVIKDAGDTGDRRVTTWHLVAAILKQPDTQAAQFLRRHNVSST